MLRSIMFTLLLTAMLSTAAISNNTVRLYVFMSPDCSNCEPAREHSIRDVAQRAGCYVELKYFNIDNLEDYRKLTALEKALGDTGNQMPVVVCGNKILGGEKEIGSKLKAVLTQYAKTGADWPDVPKTASTDRFSGNPVAVLSKYSVDAGNMLPGSEKTISLNLTNKGRSALRITGIRSACPCYKPKVGTGKLKPGQQTQVRIKIKATGVSGQIEKYVMIDTNDPAAPTLRIKVKANIPAVMKASPGRISFGNLKLGKSMEKTIKVTTTSSGLTVSSSSESIQILSSEKRGGSYVIRVRIRGVSAGRLLGHVNLTQKKPDCKTSVVVFGNIVR